MARQSFTVRWDNRGGHQRITVVSESHRAAMEYALRHHDLSMDAMPCLCAAVEPTIDDRVHPPWTYYRDIVGSPNLSDYHY